jgi:hypothetical protein
VHRSFDLQIPDMQHLGALGELTATAVAVAVPVMAFPKWRLQGKEEKERQQKKGVEQAQT